MVLTYSRFFFNGISSANFSLKIFRDYYVANRIPGVAHATLCLKDSKVEWTLEY